jgi:NAD-dependent SIR2 family protein deacetylase
MTVVVFTGAGISKLSGIPTFREPDGIWSRYDLLRVAHKDYAGSKESEDFFEQIRALCSSVLPNINHHWLYKLQQETQCKIYTSNIDMLLEQAGCTVKHVHGDVFTIKNGKTQVILYGEKGDYDELFEDIIDLTPSDTFIVAGSSCEITRVDWLAQSVKCKKIWVNPERMPESYSPNGFIQVIGKMEDCLELLDGYIHII